MDDTLDVVRDALADRFEVRREIGRGGMATVFLAIEHKHAREVAIKVLNASVSSAIGRKRFLREVRLAATLNHPNIVPILSAGEASGLLYYVMPFVSLETVRHRLVRLGVLPLREALLIVAEAANALSHAHDHDVVHRDVKPENILLANGHAVMADFGVARAISKANSESLTKGGIAVGTPRYMSPEQAVGKPVDPRSDVYALGCVLHEMLVGRVPDGPLDGGAQPDARFDNLPSSVQRVLRRALTANSSERFEHAGAFANAVKRELFALDVNPNPPAQATPWLTWRTVTVGLLTVVLAGLVAARVLFDDRRAVVHVVAFEDIGRPTVEEFGLGLREAIVAQLRDHGSIRAVPFIAHSDGDGLQNRDAGRNTFVLRGRLRWELGANVPQLRITATLARQDDGSIVWTDQYDVRLVDPTTTQSEIADRIVRGLSIEPVAR